MIDQTAGQENSIVNDIQLSITLLQHIQSQSNSADTKAQLTLGASTLLAAALTLSDISIDKISSDMSLRDCVVLIISSGIFFPLLGSIIYSVLAAWPILKIVEKQKKSLFYFHHITQKYKEVEMKEEKFVNDFLNQSNYDVRESILFQVYALAHVADKKYKFIRWSIKLFCISLVFWTILQIILLFS